MPFPPNLHRTLASDFVDEDVSLNNNWDIIDASFTSLYSATGGSPVVTGPVAGTEFMSSDGNLWVYDGSAWVSAPQETWGAWTNLNATAPYVVKSGFGAQIRVSNLKNVEMRGGFQNTASGTPFPDAGYQVLSSNQFNSTYLPEMFSVFPAATMPQSSTVGQWSQGYITIDTTGGFLAIRGTWEGTRPATGGSISIDQVRYKAL